MDLLMRTDPFSVDDLSWLGTACCTCCGRSATIDIDTFDADIHYADGYLPSGTPLGQVSSTGHWGLYDNTAHDGREVCRGFLLTAVRVRPGLPEHSTVLGAVHDQHGRVILGRLPFALDASGQADLAARFTFQA